MSTRTFRALLSALVACLALIPAGGCSVMSQGLAGQAPAPGTAGEAALTHLQSIPIKGRAPKAGYSREQFGPRWADVDRNGCDTRNDILRRDLQGLTFKPGTSECIVTAGTLTDPYTGQDIDFRRGPKSDAVEIDHIVALADAWQKGAQEWDADKRRSFANDPENLLAADGPANSQKGAGDLATWLPPNKAFRCTYAAKTVHIKSKYRLWMTAGEQATAHQILSNCT